MFLGLREFAAVQMPTSQGKITAAVAGIAPDSLAPVDLRRSSWMAILFEMEAVEKEFVVAGHVFGQRRLGGNGGRRYGRDFVRRIAEH